MAAMWLTTSLLMWALVPGLSFLHALAVASCVTPTDPVLSNVIVKGKFADNNVPKGLQRIIIAESGRRTMALGYPFLFFALYLIKYIGDGGVAESGGAGLAMGLWFGETWGYTIILSIAYGGAVGFVARELLHWAEERKFVDRESFLVFAISLALFIVGTCGMIGSDDILACFIAGNAFTWDDWFRLETLDDSLQPTVDMLLNVSIFMWLGAVCPWSSFVDNSVCSNLPFDSPRGPYSLAAPASVGARSPQVHPADRRAEASHLCRVLWPRWRVCHILSVHHARLPSGTGGGREDQA